MGWKMSMIIINSEKEFKKDELFESLGYYDLKHIDKRYWESVINPDDGRIYIGQHNGNTIICMQELPIESLDTSLSRAEKVFSENFPNADIVTFALHSVVNLWGYSVVNNGKKLRVRGGTADSGIIVESGEILEEEKELFSKSKVNANGDRVFVFEGMPNDEFEDSQVGENFVFDLSRKYFGESLDSGDALFEVELEGYTYSTSKPTNKIEEQIQPKQIQPEPNQPKQNKPSPKKPWWKFW